MVDKTGLNTTFTFDLKSSREADSNHTADNGSDDQVSLIFRPAKNNLACACSPPKPRPVLLIDSLGHSIQSSYAPEDDL